MINKTKQVSSEHLLLSWDEHNTIETSFIGDLDVPYEAGNPNTKIISIFSYEPTMETDGLYNKKMSADNSGIIDLKPTALTTSGLTVSNIPYAKLRRKPELNEYGVPTGKQTIYYEEAVLSEYFIPNSFNPYLNGLAGKELYNTNQAPSYRPGQFSNRQDGNIFIVPAMTKEEADGIRNAAYTQNQTSNLHITTNYQTKEFLRNNEEYWKTGNLKEYILMSLGEEIKEDEDGNKVVIKEENNIIRVPVKRDYFWSLGDIDPESEQGVEYIKRFLQVDPAYIDYKARTTTKKSEFSVSMEDKQAFLAWKKAQANAIEK